MKSILPSREPRGAPRSPIEKSLLANHRNFIIVLKIDKICLNQIPINWLT